ncbi:deoxyguanosinetriphosphate triphosphohydrolase [Thermospira aquatica]|uniref:Deoxyguanosinetriphosphate triphosphohydrolase n=1 Tax=Thermospira aquatica TaxID=2828656 RepID=A0AAX3BFN1_9SPIR|nr:deoxyguanosinetriphosphate triphosphohydrolase [Thermospira aquatica]URA11102.1 deoxyguanosinetriphosphate triphosphohydrolase [Thermospira aquatica]
MREYLENFEQNYLSVYATRSFQSRGRKIPEDPDELRTHFMRDRDRIIHSEAFRRLKHKTQVFLSPASDTFRTRLTHTLEVSQIARTIARALRLNEDLTEAIALGHDVGHTPFGHAGERVIQKYLDPSFRHATHSVRVLSAIEKNGHGLNLTYEVLDGIAKHSKTGQSSILWNEKDKPATLEGQIVRLADIIAYVNHDLQDALASELLLSSDIPPRLLDVIGETHSARINTLVLDVISCSKDSPEIGISEKMLEALNELRAFLFERVYMHPDLQKEMTKAEGVLVALLEHFEKLLDRGEPFPALIPLVPHDDKKQMLVDCLAFMTDTEAMKIFYQIYIPKSFTWSVR